MPTICLDAFLSKYPNTRKTVDALRARGIIVSYWSVRRWRSNEGGWPGAAMRQLLAQKRIKA